MLSFETLMIFREHLSNSWHSSFLYTQHSFFFKYIYCELLNNWSCMITHFAQFQGAQRCAPKTHVCGQKHSAFVHANQVSVYTTPGLHTQTWVLLHVLRVSVIACISTWEVEISAHANIYKLKACRTRSLLSVHVVQGHFRRPFSVLWGILIRVHNSKLKKMYFQLNYGKSVQSEDHSNGPISCSFCAF